MAKNSASSARRKPVAQGLEDQKIDESPSIPAIPLRRYSAAKATRSVTDADREELRVKQLRLAGFDGPIIEKAVVSLNKALEGEEWGEQARARDQVFQLAGLYPSRHAPISGGKLTVQVVGAAWLNGSHVSE